MKSNASNERRWRRRRWRQRQQNQINYHCANEPHPITMRSFHYPIDRFYLFTILLGMLCLCFNSYILLCIGVRVAHTDTQVSVHLIFFCFSSRGIGVRCWRLFGVFFIRSWSQYNWFVFCASLLISSFHHHHSHESELTLLPLFVIFLTFTGVCCCFAEIFRLIFKFSIIMTIIIKYEKRIRFDIAISLSHSLSLSVARAISYMLYIHEPISWPHFIQIWKCLMAPAFSFLPTTRSLSQQNLPFGAIVKNFDGAYLWIVILLWW